MYEHGGLVLRKLEASQLHLLWELKQESGWGTHRRAIINHDDQRRWFESLDRDPVSPRTLVLFATAESITPDHVGVFKVETDWVNRSAEVAWYVFPAARGFGFGKGLVQAGARFCFRVFDLRRVSCEILETNGASLRIADYVGFGREGVKREAVHKNGAYVDSCVMGLLKSEWLSHNGLGP